MKHKPWKAIAVAAALMATLPACAQQQRHRQMPQWQGSDERRFSPQRQDQPPSEMQRQEPRQHGRMSPEERRQLRHDINEAGRELYRPNPPRPLP